MTILFLNAIKIPENRQRRKFDEAKLLELQESIASVGLLHPIVVRQVNGGYQLVAGERRHRAIKACHDLGIQVRCNRVFAARDEYPCIDIGDLSEAEAYEAELEENIQRDDLTWQERATATANLMSLRSVQAARLDRPAPTNADIAREVHGTTEGAYVTSVRNEIILAKNLANPEVAKAKSAKEAFKILKHQEKRQKHAELAKKVGTTFTAADHSLMQGDCLEVISLLAPNSFDCLLTDPPYGMGADEFGDSGGRLLGTHKYDDSFDSWIVLTCELFQSLSRVMKPQSHAYIFCDIENYQTLKSNFELYMGKDWKVFRTPFIWVNPKGMRAPWPEQGPQRKYQTCLYAVRGDRPTIKLAGDVLTYPSDENLGHAAQKPVDLIRDLLSRSCVAGDSVLDPFAGSGSIFPAAHALKVKATGIELDEAAYGLAAKRLGGLST